MTRQTPPGSDEPCARGAEPSEGSSPPPAPAGSSANDGASPGDPWAHAGLPRQHVRDNRGNIVLAHTPTTREGRPWADLAWRMPEVDAARCSDALRSTLRGWVLSTEDEALATELIGRGARVLRHAHGYSRDLRADPAPSSWGAPEVPAGLHLTGVERSAEELARLLLAAYPPGHPDCFGWTPEEARQEIAGILAGRVLGPLLPCSGLALDGERVAGVCLITLRDGTPPHGGPWVIEVYRHPAPRYAGVGAALLRRALWLATREELPALSLVVSDGNPARRVYERLGFRHVGASRTLELPT